MTGVDSYDLKELSHLLVSVKAQKNLAEDEELVGTITRRVDLLLRELDQN